MRKTSPRRDQNLAPTHASTVEAVRPGNFVWNGGEGSRLQSWAVGDRRARPAARASRNLPEILEVVGVGRWPCHAAQQSAHDIWMASTHRRRPQSTLADEFSHAS